MTIDHAGDEYVYVQLADILRGQIERGELPPGRMVPSARSLSEQYGIAIGSVKRAIRLLQDEGLVHTKIGRGIFVTRRPDGDGPVDSARLRPRHYLGIRGANSGGTVIIYVWCQ